MNLKMESGKGHKIMKRGNRYLIKDDLRKCGEETMDHLKEKSRKKREPVRMRMEEDLNG